MKLGLGFQNFADRLPWRLANRLRQGVPPPTGYCCLLHADPPLVLVPEDFHDETDASWQLFFESLSDREVTFVCLIRWGIEEADGYVERLLSVLAAHRQRHPKHRFVFLANNLAQLAMFDRARLRAAFVNQNALIDEQAFGIVTRSHKRFDAVYNATMAPFKRHHLAARVPRLALITYLKRGNERYFDQTAATLDGAYWMNFPDGRPARDRYALIDRPRLEGLLAEAKVGLCLSAVEGAMFASVEYLLCGLPVVSTPSIGGRDVLFDPDHVAIVEPDPEAVADGVRRMTACRVPAAEIRSRTLARMTEHRERLLDLLGRLVAEAGKRFDREATGRRIFGEPIYKLRELHRIAKVVARHG